MIIVTQSEMEESEAIQTVVMQAAIQAAMAAVMIMRTDAGPPSSTNTVNQGNLWRHRHGRAALRYSEVLECSK